MKFKEFYSNSLDEAKKWEFDNLSFEDAKAKQKEIQDELYKHNEEIGKLEGSEKGKGLFGMTPEHIRLSPEYRTAKQKRDVAFAKLRDFNGPFIKKFKKQLRDERNRRGYDKV